MAFKFKYTCEFCGNEKVMTEEQAKTEKCECEKEYETSINLHNTWCEATEENYNALVRLGYSLKTLWIEHDHYKFLIKDNKISPIHKSNEYAHGNAKRIYLVNGKFEFVKEKSELDILKEKYKSGNYIGIFKDINNKWVLSNVFVNGFLPKLIHKKDKDILYAYLKDNTINIEVVYSLDNSSNSVNVLDFIESYDERLDYRLADKIKYPVFKLWKDLDMVVKFTDKNTSLCVFDNRNWSIGNIVNNDNIENYNNWITLSYNKEKDLYNGQPVICWDDEDKLELTLGYYSVEHDSMFTDYGKGYAQFDNILALSKEQLKAFPEMSKNFKNLKGLIDG